MSRQAAYAGLLGALLLAVAACGGSDATDDESGPRPAERLAAAVTALAEANTGRFVSETGGSDGTTYSRIEGAYQLTPPAAHATVSRFAADGERRDTEVLAIGRDAWSRDVGTSAGDQCWIHHDVAELFANGLLVRNGDTYAPVPVAVAGLGAGVYATDADQVTGTSRLSAVLSVADLSLPPLIGLDRAAEHRVPTTFTLDGDALLGWKVFLRDAVAEARKLPESNATGDGRVSALGTLDGTITTELTHLGDAVAAKPPPAGAVVEYVADPEALAAAMSACLVD
jgi:hypothetical protein